jgi:hypothetical protein
VDFVAFVWYTWADRSSWKINLLDRAVVVEACLACHAWTDGSFREAAGFGWIVTEDDKGEGDCIAKGARNIGSQQTAFDAELAAIDTYNRFF